uniref:FecR family protein n=1 Tax=Pedobacter schmidteae TaxID=2201271 RepID=UPI000EB1AB72|nr:FecR domain-containing protein [Pedobacter schmidteae]
MSFIQPDQSRILYLFKKLHELAISDEEYQELKVWTSSSAENKQVWDDFLNEEKTAQDVRVWQSFDSQAALDRLKRKAKTRKLVRYTAIAASLFLVLSLGIYLMTLQSTAPQQNLTALNMDVLPGGNKAVLKFSDQQHITLNGNQSGIEIGNNGIAYENGELLQGTKATAGALRHMTLTVPRSGKYQIKLDDGTKIWLNALTELKFPESFKGGKYRDVELLGEAYFEVAHDASRPFRVKMGEEIIEVLGTSFNLSNYESDDFTKSTLITGKIGVDLVKANGGKERTVLLPGQQAVYHKQQKRLNVFTVDGKKELAWKNGDFMFENEHIYTIIKQIERWYDVRIIYRGDFSGLYFSGIVSRTQPLSAVLDMLASTDQLKYKIDKERKEVILTAE